MRTLLRYAKYKIAAFLFSIAVYDALTVNCTLKPQTWPNSNVAHVQYIKTTLPCKILQVIVASHDEGVTRFYVCFYILVTNNLEKPAQP